MTHTVNSQDGTSIEYTTHGQGQQTVLLIHGWMVSGAVYNGLVSHLDAQDAQFVVVNLRGTGNSGAGDGYGLDHYVQDVAAVFESLDAQKVHVVGHSMGGQIAQLFAARYPDAVASLTLISPVPMQGVPLPAELNGLFSSSGQDRDKQGQILSMACLDLSDAARETLLDDAGAIDAQVIAESFASWSTGGDPSELANITAPTLVIGSDDPFLPPEFLTAAVVEPIENASMVHVAGAGHYIQLERLDACASHLSNFISKNAV